MKVRYEIKRGDKVVRTGEVGAEVKGGTRVQLRDPIRIREEERLELYLPQDVLSKLDTVAAVKALSDMYPNAHLKAELGVE